MLPMEDLNHRFAYHQPTNDGIKAQHAAVRDRLLKAANFIDSLTPDSREKSLAFTKLEEAMFWANAAIARINNYQPVRSPEESAQPSV